MSLHNGDTIAVDTISPVRLKPIEDTSNLILQPGEDHLQMIYVMNVSEEHSIEFASTEISHVDEPKRIERLSAQRYFWNAEKHWWSVNPPWDEDYEVY